MPIVQDTPTRIRLSGMDENLLKQQLSFINKAITHERQRLKHNKWALQKLGYEVWKEQLDELKRQERRCILFEDSEGFWTYSGLKNWLADKFNQQVEDLIQAPEPGRIPWAKPPEKKARPYQLEMKEKLLAARHGAVEVGTGLGKSFVILLLAKELSLKTVVMTPSKSIATQIYEEFTKHFGTRYVGRFFGGKKESNKLFVIGVDDSLSNVEPDTKDWTNLSQAEVFIADESHLCPAKSLEKVCHGLLTAAPYRFFFSGTQLRNDGQDLLLKAITGDIVFRMTVEEGVQQGWLAKPIFRMIPYTSSSSWEHPDVIAMTRHHLYYSEAAFSKAAEIANLMVEEMGRQVVILIKELEQFGRLLPYLRHDVRFAHGGVTKENKQGVPEAYWESDPSALVKDFNEGKYPILVGTSCITTGTDIQTVGALIYLQGGKSEIQIKQAVGRGTRKPPGKVDCYVIDFMPTNVPAVREHAETRAELYRSIYPDYEVLPL